MASFTGAAGPLKSGQAPWREDRRVILANLSAGHAVTHCFTQGFNVVLPYIQDHMGFGGIQYGLLLTMRQLAQGSTNIPMGFMVDMLRRHWEKILAGCLLLAAITFTIAGAAPNYWVLLAATSFVAVPGAVWHLPAFAVLSQRFPDRRGFALSTHGAGGNLGGALGPLIAGGLITVLITTEGGDGWRWVFFIYAAPAVLLTFPIFWSLRGVGREDGQERKSPLRERIRDAWVLMHNPAILALTLTILLRGLGFNALNNWAPKYLSQTADQTPLWVGLDMAMYIGLGIIFAPILGSLSDRIGRKQVVVPGMIVAALLAVAVVQVGSNVLLLALLFAAMGPFSHTLSQLLQASVLDLVGRGTEATSLGLVMGIQGLVMAGSPLLIGYFTDHLGMESLFYYAAIIFMVAVVVLMLVPIAPRHAAVSKSVRMG